MLFEIFLKGGKRFWIYLFFLLTTYLSSCNHEEEAISVFKGGTDIKKFALFDGKTRFNSFDINDTAIFISVNNGCNLHNISSEFTHNGEKVLINGLEQLSGESTNDYSDFVNNVVCRVVSDKGTYKERKVYLFDIPVVIVKIENNDSITNKEEWKNGRMKIIDTYGNEIENTDICIKGRGNASWTSDSYKKKSYSLKLESKKNILGMPKSKRWILLGTAGDHTKIRTPICFSISESVGFEWSPKGQNVELIINGKLLCNYFLCEQIRAEKNRIDIQEMTPEDTIGESATGGVLFEVSGEYDEKFKFKSSRFDLPFMLKNPNDNVHDNQINYFKSFIDSLEYSLISDSMLYNNIYLNYIDIDSYIRWWLVNNISTNREVLGSPKNFYMYKDRGYNSKLYAAPPWDFDWGTFWSSLSETWIFRRYWYERLLSNDYYIQRLKYIWNEVKEVVYSATEDLIKEKRNSNYNSVMRDQYLYPVINANEENGMEYNEAIDYIQEVFRKRMEWLDRNINSL